MDFSVLQTEIQQYIIEKTGSDVSKVALQKNPFPAVEWSMILSQIAARTKAKNKLPTWFETGDIVYPSKISVEQTSSEITAQYKSEIVSGESLIDLTGGFGVDDFYFSKTIDKVIHCEKSEDLSAIAKHNFEQLKVRNIECLVGDSTTILQKSKTKFDWIYIDPSRRDDFKGKVFLLKDCTPNVPENLDLYFNHSERILIKTAPLLDITAGLAELKNVSEIHIVAVDNEVKELLWLLSKDFSGSVKIKAVNIAKTSTIAFESNFAEENTVADLSEPKTYLFEPNSAVMKSGAFEQVATIFGIHKLHKHSHLYTSDKPVERFPGRTFAIKKRIPYQKMEIKKLLEGTKANIVARNFPESVESIRKRWKITDGGDLYCFFTTDLNENKIALICTKI